MGGRQAEEGNYGRPNRCCICLDTVMRNLSKRFQVPEEIDNVRTFQFLAVKGCALNQSVQAVESKVVTSLLWRRARMSVRYEEKADYRCLTWAGLTYLHPFVFTTSRMKWLDCHVSYLLREPFLSSLTFDHCLPCHLSSECVPIHERSNTPVEAILRNSDGIVQADKPNQTRS